MIPEDSSSFVMKPGLPVVNLAGSKVASSVSESSLIRYCQIRARLTAPSLGASQRRMGYREVKMRYPLGDDARCLVVAVVAAPV
jgi:hypothetical protein